jgi:transposase
MMGQREVGQGQFFYAFDLDRVVPVDHLVRQIDPVLDLSWVHKELAPYYSHTGRPSIDPVLMIRMLIIGYVFAIRSERAICAKLKVNLAYRWFCKLSIEDEIPDHSDADAPHPLGLLCCRGVRPRRHAADKRDEITPS